MLKFIRKNLLNIIMTLIFISGIAITAYPTISDFVNTKIQDKNIENYDSKVKSLSNKNSEQMKLQAHLYNQSLYKVQSTGSSDNTDYEYEDLLNPDGNGLMGYIVIPRVDIKLPIYHGIDESVLNVGAGHFPSSSLPIGGNNTHTLILGHRGLPTMKLFNDLDKVTTDDYFELHILDEVLYYRVYNTEIVLPDKVSNLRIENGKDLVTLITCTPYGINTHRLLVHGERISDPTAELLVSSEATTVNTSYVTIAIAVFLWIVILIALIILSTKHKQKRLSNGEYIRRAEIISRHLRRNDDNE